MAICYNFSMFEWDKNKNLINIEKHKISFEEAQQAWDDADSVDFPSNQDKEEDRFLKIAKVRDAYFTIIYTLRKKVVRIISARRSRDEEKNKYEENL
jgi:uncharacterized DUF497 family protein